MILFATDYLKEEMDFNNEKIMDEFNDRVGRQFDDFMIFLNTHYVSNRDDSDFWKYVKNECIHEDTLNLINKWKNQLPRMSDFELYLSPNSCSVTTLLSCFRWPIYFKKMLEGKK